MKIYFESLFSAVAARDGAAGRVRVHVEHRPRASHCTASPRPLQTHRQEALPRGERDSHFEYPTHNQQPIQLHLVWITLCALYAVYLMVAHFEPG